MNVISTPTSQLYLTTLIDLQLRSNLTPCEIGPRTPILSFWSTVAVYMVKKRMTHDAYLQQSILTKICV